MSREASLERELDELAEALDRTPEALRAEVEEGIGEMRARHSALPMRTWSGLGRWLLRGYDLTVDRESLARLRAIDSDHTLVWLPSHRSYLDTWALPLALDESDFPPYFVIGGANLDFWPFGDVARRTGLVFIRRAIGDDPVYRLALRRYLGHLVRERSDFGWSIEGGRTRTGKLRPPRYGLLRYLADTVRAEGASGVLLVPVSIVYDRLQEVPTMTSESRGARKRPEDLRWLVNFARGQGRRRGRVYVDVGEPLDLAEALERLEREAGDRAHVVERVALEVCHRINRVTPVVPSAVVTLALLGAGRGLTLAEVAGQVEPVARYLERRDVPVACDARLGDPELLRRTLSELVEAGAAVCFGGGREPVWSIGAEQHLVAAFYRNSLAHFLVDRAIAELVRLRVGGAAGEPAREAGAAEALRLRDLLKFEFFFPRKRDFLEAMRTEIGLLDEDEAGGWAWLVLRPFLQAYELVAAELADRPAGEAVDEDGFLRACLGVGHQRRLQGRLASPESVSLELFGTAVRLLRHRGLWDPGGGDLAERRRAFADELSATVQAAEAAAPAVAASRSPNPASAAPTAR